MTLMHPCFNFVGKKKGKQKFRSAEEARKARELSEQWEKNNEKWKSMSTVKKTVKKPTKITQEFAVPAGRETVKVNRLNSWVTGPVSTKQPQQYTGSNVLGITIVHKSCLQPVFNQQQAIDAATMRR
jgi:hypothetical protein